VLGSGALRSKKNVSEEICKQGHWIRYARMRKNDCNEIAKEEAMANHEDGIHLGYDAEAFEETTSGYRRTEEYEDDD
jgi:hypothetical protein